MADRLDKTVRIVRRSKVTTDDRGRTVWTDPVDSAELELVTTTMLTHMLESDDEEQKQRIREAAGGKEGLLARDVEKGRFEIIDDDDLQAALAASAEMTPTARPADVTFEVVSNDAGGDTEELSLVSTQALRRLLHKDTEQASEDLSIDDDGGFDPYNSG